jgi:xanthine dehydrogenase YagT iron-sulfur-binding subunit
MNDQETPNTGPSRREFVMGTGAAVTATALTALATPEALAADLQPGGSPAVPAVGPGAVKITLNVNGRDMQTNVEPRVTLLDALRNYLDVTGCKRVCDRGTCGACTVMLEGKVIYSCTMLAVEAQGKAIRTAESLFNGGKVDAVPAAFVRADAQQCGFCTPGFVVAMKAVLCNQKRGN